jgi:bile acid-coenzyme A ligase
MTQPAADPVPLGVRVGQLAEARGDAAAVICGDVSRSWTELDLRTNRLARALAARGVDRGGFVTIGLPNGVEFIETCIACWKVGAVPQPVSSRLPAKELHAIVELANPAVVVTAGDLGVDRHAVHVDDLLAGSDDDSPLPPVISPAWKAPTSGGSTGRPKLIVSGQPGVFGELSRSVWRHRDDGVALMPGPLYHNGPFTSAFQGLMQGSTLVLEARFDAEETLRLIDAHRVTWVYLVPAMMGRIWRLPDDVKERYDLSSLETVWHLAAPCPPWLKQAWIDWVGADKIWELYAGTEAQAGTVISGAEWLEHRGSVGRVAYGEMVILDETGQPLPAGAVGEVFLRRPPGTPPSYRYIGAEPRRHGDWESLGDVGWFDADGYLYLADRHSDMILVGGSNVYPAEVEAALDEHPLVRSSCVIGLPDDDLGNVVHAIIQADPALDLDDLRAHVGQRLVRYKHPRTFEIVDEPLRDDAGKMRRSALRAARLADGRPVRQEAAAGGGS